MPEVFIQGRFMTQAAEEQWTLAKQVYERLMQANVVPANGEAATEGTKMAIPAATRQEEEVRKKIWNDRRKANYDEGEKNRLFYAENSAKTGLPWQQTTKMETQYSEFILLTPAMAAVLLDHNPRNRTLKTSTLEAYKRDILADRWLQTDEAIGIDVNGNLYNGQHRCTAVLQTGKSVVFYFTFNVPVEAKFVVDSGVKRSTAEKLSYVIDHTLSTRLAATARAMMRGVSTAKTKPSDSEIAAFATKYQEIIQWTCKELPGVRADVVAAVAKYALKYGKDEIYPFCDRLHNLTFTSANDPTAALYKYLTKSGEKGVTVYRKTLAALEHYQAKRDVKALHERDDDILDFDNKFEIVGN
jgi:hypothetical protein